GSRSPEQQEPAPRSVQEAGEMLATWDVGTERPRLPQPSRPASPLLRLPGLGYFHLLFFISVRSAVAALCLVPGIALSARSDLPRGVIRQTAAGRWRSDGIVSRSDTGLCLLRVSLGRRDLPGLPHEVHMARVTQEPSLLGTQNKRCPGL